MERGRYRNSINTKAKDYSVTMKKILFLLAFLFIGTTTAEAATYWVSQQGSNGNTNCVNSTSQPANLGPNSSPTIVAGITCLSAGDTLYVMPGAYTESIGGVDRIRPMS